MGGNIGKTEILFDDKKLFVVCSVHASKNGF